MEEMKAIDMESREQSTPNQELRFLKALRKMAVQWMNDEMEFYQKSKGSCKYSPFKNEETSSSPPDPPIDHLVSAAIEFSRRFSFRSVEDEEDINSYNNTSSLTERPALLVANRVRDDWKSPDESANLHSVCFMKVPGDTVDSTVLFIDRKTWPKHGRFNGWIANNFDDWICSNGLRSILDRIPAGGVGHEPDEAYCPSQWSGNRNHPNLDVDEIA